MNFIKRAFIAVTRRKGKSIIMFIMFFVIANLVLAGFAIQDATKEASNAASEDVKASLSSLNTDNLKLVFSFDTQKAMEEAREEQSSSTTTTNPGRINVSTLPITVAMANKLANLDHVIDVNYIVSGGGMADGFTTIETTENATTASESTTSDSDSDTSGTSSSENSGNVENRIPSGGINFTIPDVTVTGVSSTELADEFNSGGYTLISGRHIVPEDANKKVVVIETTLAKENSLKVGSKIKLAPVTADSTTETSVSYKIVGIFKAGTSTTTTTSDFRGGFGNMGFSQSYNTIFMDYKSSLPLKFSMNPNSSSTAGIDKAVFYADDLSNIEAVKTAAAKISSIDWTKYKLTSSYDEYKQIYETTLAQTTKSISSVASISKVIVIAAGLIGAIILALILMLSIKERMYETGVLLSMGEGKLKVISQYLVEVILVATLAFGFSIFSGNYLDQKLGDSLLQNQIKTEQSQTANMQNAVGGDMNGGQNRRLFQSRSQATTTVKAATTISVKVTPLEVAETAGAGLLIILLAIILPASTIMRYKPKTILTKAT
ncbi:MAG: ABC transporter permease [Clostridia bacterium]